MLIQRNTHAGGGMAVQGASVLGMLFHQILYSRADLQLASHMVEVSLLLTTPIGFASLSPSCGHKHIWHLCTLPCVRWHASLACTHSPAVLVYVWITCSSLLNAATVCRHGPRIVKRFEGVLGCALASVCPTFIFQCTSHCFQSEHWSWVTQGRVKYTPYHFVRFSAQLSAAIPLFGFMWVLAAYRTHMMPGNTGLGRFGPDCCVAWGDTLQASDSAVIT